MIRINSGIMRLNNGLPYLIDVNASKVIEAVRSTGVTITHGMINYAHYLISNMNNIGTWQLSNAVYGFVGGTDASHKFNWKDLRDVDAAFRLSYNGGITHSANGMQGNGTTGFANTNFIPSISNIDINNNHISFYSRTENLQNSVEIGSYDIANPNPSSIRISTFYNGLKGAIFDDGGVLNRLITTGYNSKGFFIGNRVSTSQKLFRNGIKIGERTASGGGNYNSPITLLGFNSSSTASVSFFSTKETPFSTIGAGFTDAQAIAQSQIVTNAQLILNRA